MRMTGATAQLAERMQKDPTENALKQITAHIAARRWTEVLTMTIYCDNEQCGHNEDGFCWADKLHLDSNGVCMTESNGAYTAKDENGGADNG